jgi:putative transposase
MANPTRHRKTVRHVHSPGDCHELTFSCFQRRPLLVDEAWRAELARTIDRAVATCAFRLVAFVFMPEHVHLLLYPSDPRQAAISRLLKAIKQPVSSYVRRALNSARDPRLDALTVQDRSAKREFRFWQQGPGYDRNLNSPNAVTTCIDYIHSNPVKRGLCEKAADWKWSSARHYELVDAAEDSDLPKIHGLPAHYLT